MSGTVQSVQIYTVHPTNEYNHPLPPPIRLHCFDLMGSPIQIRNHRFYRPPQSLSPTDVIDKLKSSLAEALELYPPVSGIVQANDQGELHIVSDNKTSSGTPFLVEMKNTPFAGDNEDLCPRLEMLLPLSSSTLAVKITQFSCGTVAVAASIHHQVVDLSGYLDFLEVWAELARGETINLSKIPADWTRTPGRFFPCRVNTKSTSPPGFKVLPVPPTEGPSFSPAAVTRWKFTKNAVERLKSDFSPSTYSLEEHNQADLWISSGDALATLSWGVITRARKSANLPRSEVFGGSSLESQTETLAMAADGRDRSPQGNMLNRQYFGNFNVLPIITVPRSDLLSLTFSSSSRVALQIRNALKVQLSSEAITEKISFMEDLKNVKPPGHIAWTADVVLTNWCRFDLQGTKFDFGWGKPFYATAGSGGLFPPGYVMLMQDKSSGDVFVMMTVEREGVDHLKADALLNKYAIFLADH
eukprot:TRINITY_DN10580_c0_g1_i2.p1 TRINITY_DN10580_c0_g1~~TRINITY_DN10580_c0_g1_i2.p1  ORF type:complete len:471 (-),score=86.20 TRINITY_DN10580_c0_g1_i2:418-1830(-)